PHLAVLAVSFFRHREQDRGPLLRRLSRHLEHRRVLRFRLPHADLGCVPSGPGLRDAHVRAPALGAPAAHAAAVARYAETHARPCASLAIGLVGGTRCQLTVPGAIPSTLRLSAIAERPR